MSNVTHNNNNNKKNCLPVLKLTYTFDGGGEWHMKAKYLISTTIKQLNESIQQYGAK